MENYEDAERTFEAGISRNGHDPLLWCSFGELHHLTMRLDDAVAAFRRAIALNPYMPEIWIKFGALYKTRGCPEDAAECDLRVRELIPAGDG